MTYTVVIGGGIAGLATATLLAHEGHNVRLLEQSDRVGGRAGVITRDGFFFDTGPSWYLMPRVFEHYFELLGTSADEQLDLRMLDPGYIVYSEPETPNKPAKKLTVPHGENRVRDEFEDIEPGSSETLKTYLDSARRASQMAEDYFLYNPFTSPFSLLNKDVLQATPQLASLLGTSLQRYVAKRFSNPRLQQVLGYPAVFLGTEPKRAPAMYHLMSALDLDEGVQYPMGGFWGLVETLKKLASEAGVDIVTHAEVTEIITRREHGRSKAVGVRWRNRVADDETPQTVVDHADVVVSAADLHHTETRLLDEADRTFPETWWKKRQSGPGAVIALLGVEGELPEMEHHTLFFTKDWDANFEQIFGKSPRIPDPASIYVCKPSATEPAVAPEGHENLFVLIPVPADPTLGSGGPDRSGNPAIENAVDAAVQQISHWAGIPDLAERIVVRETIGPTDFVNDYNSWSGGMLGPAHILSQSAMFRAQNKSKKVDGLYYAGSTVAPGVGVPMCLISAEVVLKRIRGDHSPGPTKPRHKQNAAPPPKPAVEVVEE